MSCNIRNFYAGGNTAKGFYSFYDSAFAGLNRLFILKGGPGTGKSTLIRTIGENMVRRGYDIEFYHCSSDNGSLDGVIIPSLKIGIVDGTAPHVIEPKAPGAVEEYVKLGQAWDSNKLAKQRQEIEQLSSEISASFQTAYGLFAEALRIHDEWEKIYISNMDFGEADKLTGELIERFFGNQTKDKTSVVRDRFFGAATPIGPVDYIQNLTEGVGKRFFIKGRPGSGKSTMLKKLVTAGESRGFDVEVHHCGFDPNSLDMVLLPELGIAIFDSTAPHEYFPERETDEIVDMYARTITPGTDEKFAAELEDIVGRYSAKMKEATSSLAKAKALHDDLETIYVAAINFNTVDKIHEDIQTEINTIADLSVVTGV
jgi:Cdc6-like AAA superfamily ATPase